MNITSIDIGFGWTKAKYKGRYFIQPSILGDKRPLHDENKRENYLIYENYFLGELQPAFIVRMKSPNKIKYDNSFITKRHAQLYGRHWKKLQMTI